MALPKTVYDPTQLPQYSDFGFLPPPGTVFAIDSSVWQTLSIVNPNDSSIHVNIPILLQRRYIRPDQIYWQEDRLFDSSDENDSRVSHVVTVYNTGDLDFGIDNGNSPDNTQTVDVERVDQCTISTFSDDMYAPGQSWEYTVNLDTVSGEGDQNTPAHFIGPNDSRISHVCRWFQSDDDTGQVTDTEVFVDVEYVDQLSILQGDDGEVGAMFNQEYKEQFINTWTNAFNSDGTIINTVNPHPIMLTIDENVNVNNSSALP